MNAIYWRVYDMNGNLVLTTARVSTIGATENARRAIRNLRSHGYRVTRVTVRNTTARGEVADLTDNG